MSVIRRNIRCILCIISYDWWIQPFYTLNLFYLTIILNLFFLQQKKWYNLYMWYSINYKNQRLLIFVCILKTILMNITLSVFPFPILNVLQFEVIQENISIYVPISILFPNFFLQIQWTGNNLIWVSFITILWFIFLSQMVLT